MTELEATPAGKPARLTPFKVASPFESVVPDPTGVTTPVDEFNKSNVTGSFASGVPVLLSQGSVQGGGPP